MALNVGINGFGRIGRIIFRSCLKNSSLKISAINDPAVDIDYICYLIKFDSTHGRFEGTVERSDNDILVNGHKITIFREKLPTNIPWQKANVQYIVEASGMFTNLEKASGHLTSDGVKRVIVTAPCLDVPMVVLGVNDDTLDSGHKVISCASSTLYCLAPIIHILEENFGVSEGFITSIHAMTPSLKPLDGLCLKGKHWRDHRSIHQNIIPATTGACRALGKIIPQVKDKISGLAFRVPIVNVSVLDITIRLKRNTTMDEIVHCVEKADKISKNKIIKVSKEQAVSSDFIGDTYSCILDLNSSLQLTSDFFKLICWYENEYSYACRVIDCILFLENQYQLEWKSKMTYIRPTQKQSLIQQPDNSKTAVYHQVCSYDCHTNSKCLCSTSQDSGFKSPKRAPLPKSPMYCRNFDSKQHPFASRVPKRKNELFKIWKDHDERVKTPLRHNRSSFFHSCVAIAPQIRDLNAYAKTQERLENVKREFNKMVSMTKDLLKKSNHGREKGFSEEPFADNAGDSNINTFNICDEPNFSLVNSSNCPTKKENLGEIIKEDKDKTNKNKIHNDKEEYKSVINKIGSHLKNKPRSIKPESVKCNESNISRLLLNKVTDTGNNNLENNDVRLPCSVISKHELQMEECIISTNKDTKETTNIQLDIKPNIPFAEKKKNDNTLVCTPFKVINCNDRKNIAFDININPTENITKKQEYKNNLNSKSNPSTPELNPTSACYIDESEKVNIEKQKSGIKGLMNRNDYKNRNLQKRLEGILKKLAVDGNILSEKPSTCLSADNTTTTVSNRENKQNQDIYDKLDSVSATDSENSFHMKERKSQVINITDLTNSLEDLERLDKICRIIEISDDLSDQLLSALNSYERKDLNNTNWSFKDLCEKIKLDDFCNKMFSKANK